MAELQLAGTKTTSCQQQFQELIANALCSIEILSDNVQAKIVKLTADCSLSSKQVACEDADWESTITGALQYGARKAVMGSETSDKLEETASHLSDALIENDTIVVLLERILVGFKEPSVLDVTSEVTLLSNVTKAINALEDFCTTVSSEDIKSALEQAVNLPRTLQIFYSFASELFFCKFVG